MVKFSNLYWCGLVFGLPGILNVFVLHASPDSPAGLFATLTAIVSLCSWFLWALLAIDKGFRRLSK